MGKAGILKEGERVELIDGDILTMAPIGSEHVSSVNVSTLALIRRIGDNAFVSIQAPVRLDDNTEPEPDIALLKWRDDFYRSRLPISEDALLIIEAADTSLAYDRGEKLAMYAYHGIPEVWISNLRDRVIEAHSEPVDGVYAKSRVYRPGETISPRLPAGRGNTRPANRRRRRRRRLARLCGKTDARNRIRHEIADATRANSGCANAALIGADREGEHDNADSARDSDGRAGRRRHAQAPPLRRMGNTTRWGRRESSKMGSEWS